MPPFKMPVSGETILNVVIGMILAIGGIASTLVAIYPRMTFDKNSRYTEVPQNTTLQPAQLKDPSESN